jgi:hypothetical protein
VRASNALFALIGALWAIFTALAFAVVFGLLLGAVHPILGLMAAMGAIGVAWGVRKRRGLWSGLCPYCAQEVSITHGSGGVNAFDCPICKRRILLKDGRFQIV